MAGSEYFDHTTYPTTGSFGSSSSLRTELDNIEAGFSKLPDLSGNGSKVVAVNSGGTALEAITTTGTGNGVRATSPTFTTPVLGVATATTVNKITWTTPASGATVTIADGKTFTVSNTLTFTGTDASSVAFGAGGTVAYTGSKLSAFAATTSAELAGVISDETGSGSLVFGTSPTLVTPTIGVATATSVNKVAFTAPATSATLAIADGKTLTASNTLTFTGTDSSSVAFGTGGTVTYAAALSASTGSSLIGHIGTGTGVAATTVQVKLRERVSVKADFGAVGDGVTDDRAAIQAAIDAIFSAGGGRVHIPAGVYLLGASLDRKAGVYLEGDGAEFTELKANGNFQVITAIGTSGSVRNRGGAKGLLIRGFGKGSTSAHGIYEEWTNRSIYEDIRFHGCRYGMYVSNVWQCKWDNLHVDGGGADQSHVGFYMAEVDPSNQNNAVQAVNCMAQGTELYGFRLINFNGSKFTSCEAADTGTHAWYLGDPTTGTEAIRWGHFVNCLGDTVSGHIWRLEKGAATSLKQIQLTNCWAGTSSGGHGFYVGGGSEIIINSPMVASVNKSAVHFASSSRCVLSGGSLNEYDGAAAANSGVALVDSSFNQISSNHVYSTSGTAKGLVESGTSDSNMIIGNHLQAGITKVGTNSKFTRNTGAVCEKNGSAQITAAATSVTVTHGIGFTPSINDVRLTPRDGMGSTTKLSAQNMTATTFDIVANIAPGGTITIAWGIDPGA